MSKLCTCCCFSPELLLRFGESGGGFRTVEGHVQLAVQRFALVFNRTFSCREKVVGDSTNGCLLRSWRKLPRNPATK